MAEKKKTNVKKISTIAKSWKEFQKDFGNESKANKFFSLFLKKKFWLKLDETEKKNYNKFGKQGIKKGHKFSVAITNDGVIPIFEDRKELIRFVAKSKLNEDKICTIKQSGEEIIKSMIGSSEYAIKIKGIRSFIALYPQYVTYIKKYLL